MITKACECGWKHNWPEQMPQHTVKCRCGRDMLVGQPSKMLPWVRFVRLLRKPEDKGIGDTVQRIAAKFGGERFKAFAKRIGLPCRCTERQAEWNQLWPY